MSQNYSITVPAGLAVLVTAPGNVLTMNTVGGAMHVTLDGKNSTPVFPGAVVNGPFHYLNFFNDSATDLPITFYVGNAAVPIPVNTSKSAGTYPKGTDLSGGAQLNSGATAVFSGMDGANIRKQITVQNLDTNGRSVWVLDASLRPLVVLTPASPPWTVESSGAFTLKNFDVAPLSRVVVGETFYS